MYKKIKIYAPPTELSLIKININQHKDELDKRNITEKTADLKKQYTPPPIYPHSYQIYKTIKNHLHPIITTQTTTQPTGNTISTNPSNHSQMSMNFSTNATSQKINQHLTASTTQPTTPAAC